MWEWLNSVNTSYSICLFTLDSKEPSTFILLGPDPTDHCIYTLWWLSNWPHRSIPRFGGLEWVRRCTIVKYILWYTLNILHSSYKGLLQNFNIFVLKKIQSLFCCCCSDNESLFSNNLSFPKMIFLVADV